MIDTARITLDASRGIGASSGDTLALVAEVGRLTNIADSALQVARRCGSLTAQVLEALDALRIENQALRADAGMVDRIRNAIDEIAHEVQA